MIPGQTSLATHGVLEYLLFDAIDPHVLPKEAEAVAGYVDGNWPNYIELCSMFPHAHQVSITVFGRRTADVIDCEKGDATPSEAVEWLLRQRDAGHWAPGIYASLSVWPELLRLLQIQAVPRHHYRMWTAHWTGHAHRCNRLCKPELGNVVAGATQFTNAWKDRPVDCSLAWQQFFVR